MTQGKKIEKLAKSSRTLLVKERKEDRLAN